MKNKNLHISVLLTAFVVVIALSCSRDQECNVGSPSYKIRQSEKLVIPAEIDLPLAHPGIYTRVATFYAEGVQKYKAQVKAGSNPAFYEWVFVAPKAELFDASNKILGTHGAGPYWALAVHDSIFAQPFSPAKTASPDGKSIPWLLLMPRTGTIPTGIFSNVAYIQRIGTTGGIAPATAPQSLSDTADVFYTAVYRFTKTN